MSWLYLVLAGLFEVGFTTCLKLSDNFKRPFWSVMFLIAITCSFWLLSKASRDIPLGTAYAVWTGIGAAGTVLVGIIFFREPAFFWRVFFIFTLVASIVGLRLVTR